jgi:hypothetical protein
MNQRSYILSENLSEESSDIEYHSNRVYWVDRNVLLSRKRKLSALYYSSLYATVDTSKYDNAEYRDHECAFLDANDLERSVTSLHTTLIAISQLSPLLRPNCG